MNPTLRKILLILLSIGTFLYFIFALFAFADATKTGILWLIGALLLVPVLISSFTKNKTINISKGIKIGLLVLSFILFIAGGAFLPASKYKTVKSSKEVSQNNIATQKEEVKTTIDTVKLKAFQKKWADSVVKIESNPKDGVLIGAKLNLPDTILFEYTADMTKYGYDANIGNDTVMYREWYVEAIKNLGKEYKDFTVYISCIPNQKVAGEAAKRDIGVVWEHPLLAFQGVTVYKGNEFYKEKVGVVFCVEGIRGEQTVNILSKKGMVQVSYYDFKKYWVLQAVNQSISSLSEVKCN